MDRNPLIFSAAVLVSLLAAAPAHADDAEQRRIDYKHNLNNLRDESDKRMYLDDRYTIAGCADLMKDDAFCTEFAKWHRVAEAQRALFDAEQWNWWLTQIDVASNHEENQEKLVASAENCTKEMERLLSDGLATDVSVMVGQPQRAVSLAHAKDEICAPLAKVAKGFAKQVSAEREKRLAAIAAPYKKAGITGDRLDLCIHYDNAVFRGIGGNELSSPAQIKRAGVLFVTLGPSSDDGTYTVTKYVFKGDKLVSSLDAQYILKPGSKAYH
jgi:hypothetical protein